MSKKKRAGAAPEPAPEAPDRGQQTIEWIAKYRRQVTGTLAAVIVITAGVWMTVQYQRNKGAQADRSLNEARVAAQSGNLPLAASDLSRLIASHGGTAAADEAIILLAQVRLIQDEPSLAVQELRGALSGGLEAQFRAPAYGLLGTAEEQLGNMAAAGEAYERAAEESWYTFLEAQYLSDAGRVYWAAGDTTRALEAYERVLSEFEDSPSSTEARVRLGELRAAIGAARG
ncbi:MAG: tetratricopeptide repeat protein [Gemmatimonadales bacterium]